MKSVNKAAPAPVKKAAPAPVKKAAPAPVKKAAAPAPAKKAIITNAAPKTITKRGVDMTWGGRPDASPEMEIVPLSDTIASHWKLGWKN